jgi:hypothetical protein
MKRPNLAISSIKKAKSLKIKKGLISFLPKFLKITRIIVAVASKININ